MASSNKTQLQNTNVIDTLPVTGGSPSHLTWIWGVSRSWVFQSEHEGSP